MTRCPRISVVTSSFNQAKFIARTIESVRAQEYPNVEHIVVDAMSSDGTADVLATYPHLRVIREPDRGQADAINKGFGAATGEIFGFLNSDDTLEPGALWNVARAVDPAAGRHIVMGRCRFIDEDDRFLGVEHPSAFESHRRVLEIWKGHCLPQPAVFWTRRVWDECGPLRADEHLMLDYDLFCRFSQRYSFHAIRQVIANYRLHTESKTSSVTDEQRLNQAIAVSRRYWGSPVGLQYWLILASYGSFRFNRRVRAVRFLRSGRDSLREGRRSRALRELAIGSLLGPDVVADVALMPLLKPILAGRRRGSASRRRPIQPHTEAWLGRTSLHDDGWAGPTFVTDVHVDAPDSVLTLTGTSFPDYLRGRLTLEAFIDGRSLGSRAVGRESCFALSWRLADVRPGPHEVRFAASTFMVPDDRFGNQDFRPLSYRVGRVELTVNGSVPHSSSPVRLCPSPVTERSSHS
jgi:glycosyltransferase involved in cell wall biosynthesis